jgi:hypothetical protein
MKILKAITAILSILAFMTYQYVLVEKGKDISELYFVALSVTTAVFAFFSIRENDSFFVSSIVVLCASFFVAMSLIYIWRWIILGDGSTNFYTAVCISAVLTFIYLIIYGIREYKRT